MIKLLFFTSLLIFAQILSAAESDQNQKLIVVGWIFSHSYMASTYEKSMREKFESDKSEKGGHLGGPKAAIVLGVFDGWKKANSNSQKNYTGIKLQCDKNTVSFSYLKKEGYVASENTDISQINDDEFKWSLQECCNMDKEYLINHGMRSVCSKLVDHEGNFSESNSASASQAVPATAATPPATH
jgi:hypothetical protein